MSVTLIKVQHSKEVECPYILLETATEFIKAYEMRALMCNVYVNIYAYVHVHV